MEMSDPELGRVSITEVEMADDLKKAYVYFTLIGEPSDATSETFRAFKRAVPFIRTKLGRSLGLRYVPEIEFIEDKHQGEVNRIMGILDNLHTPHPESPEKSPEKS